MMAVAQRKQEARALDTSTIVFASHNEGKVKAVKDFFRPYYIEVYSSAECDLKDVEETGSSFYENAAIKALAAAKATKMPAIADDSGICLYAFGGEPGIRTARWAGEGKTNDQKIQFMLDKLKGQDSREADVICVIALAWPDGHVEYAKGAVKCEIAKAPRGVYGFGHDAILIPEGETRTFAEMLPQEKAKVSHRGCALQNFVKKVLV
jgi:XTP/dITP diphosphohydrolase